MSTPWRTRRSWCRPPRPPGSQVLRDFYDTIVERTVPVSSPRVAELAKVFENTQAYVNIALVNELAEICHDLDIDVHEMIDAAMTKGHSMADWYPGPGVGGHCLPIDPMYLAWQTRELAGPAVPVRRAGRRDQHGRPPYVVERRDRAAQRARPRDQAAPRSSCSASPTSPTSATSGSRRRVEVVQELIRYGAIVHVADPHVDGLDAHADGRLWRSWPGRSAGSRCRSSPPTTPSSSTQARRRGADGARLPPRDAGRRERRHVVTESSSRSRRPRAGGALAEPCRRRHAG